MCGQSIYCSRRVNTIVKSLFTIEIPCQNHQRQKKKNLENDWPCKPFVELFAMLEYDWPSILTTNPVRTASAETKSGHNNSCWNNSVLRTLSSSKICSAMYLVKILSSHLHCKLPRETALWFSYLVSFSLWETIYDLMILCINVLRNY